MNGNKPSQRMEYYSKYKKSTIFTEDNPTDKSQNITSKITNRKGQGQGKEQWLGLEEFQPKYKNEITDKERYLSQYWNRKDIIQSSNKASNLKAGLINKKLNDEKYNEYLANDKFIPEFNTNRLSTLLQKETEKNKTQFRKSKSFWQSRSKAGIILEGNEKMNHKTKKIEALASNIFNQKDKEEIVLYKKTLPLTSRSNHNKNERNHQIKNRSSIASVFDWKYSNTELSNKTHIRSKTIDPSTRKQQELISHFQDKLIIKPLIKNKIAQNDTKAVNSRTYKNKQLNACSNKEIEQYEINSKLNFDTVDAGKIKQMFLSQGIHIYNYEDHGSSVNGYQSGRIAFNIRRDKNDHLIQVKINQIKSQIQALGLKIKQIVKETHIKKERPQTPGKELIKSTKLNKYNCEE